MQDQDPSSAHLYDANSIPILGRTRCYWVILNAALEFVYLDPILEVHLGDQVDTFMGTNMLNYVHPDESESLSKDLMPIEGVLSGVQAAGVMGSVTRCRYARIPRIRKMLGCESPPQGYDSWKFAWMGDFLDLKITTSWIGGVAGDEEGGGSGNGRGAVLAFFHGIEDKDSEQDNNELDTSGGWSNFCGPRTQDGVYLSPAQCQQLGRVLANLSMEKKVNPMSTTFSSFYSNDFYPKNGPPAVVFQILNSVGEIILSFPSPDRAATAPELWYNVEDYAKLARAVLARPRESSESTTSCTRRYRSKHPIFDSRTGSLVTVDSIVILYGAITFVVFETGGVYLSAVAQASRTLYPNGSGQMKEGGVNAETFAMEDVPTGAGEAEILVRRESVGYGEGNNNYREDYHDYSRPTNTLSLHIAPPPRHYTPTVASDRGYSGELSPTVVSASAILGSFSNSFPTRLESGYDFNGPPYSADSSGSISPTFSFRPGHQLQYSNSTSQAPATRPLSNLVRPPMNNSFSGQPLSHATTYSPYPPPQPPPPPQQPPMIPPSIIQAQRQSPVATVPNIPVASPARINSPKSDGKKKGGKAKKIPAPKGKKCLHCDTVDSPEWRKGPGGGKTLCNACGLRYSRSLAKLSKSNKLAIENGSKPVASGSNNNSEEDQLAATPSPTIAPRETIDVSVSRDPPPPIIERRPSPLTNLLYSPNIPMDAPPVLRRPSPLSASDALSQMSAAESNHPSRNERSFRGNINPYSRPPPHALPLSPYVESQQPDYSQSPHSDRWPSRNRPNSSNHLRRESAPQPRTATQEDQQRRQQFVNQQSNPPLAFAPSHHFAPPPIMYSHPPIPNNNVQYYQQPQQTQQLQQPHYEDRNDNSGLFRFESSNSMSAQSSNSNVINYQLEEEFDQFQ